MFFKSKTENSRLVGKITLSRCHLIDFYYQNRMIFLSGIMLGAMVLLLNSCKHIHEPDETDIIGVWTTPESQVHIISTEVGFSRNWPEKAKFQIKFNKDYTFKLEPHFYPGPSSILKYAYESSYASTSGKWKYNQSQNSLTMEITEAGDVSRISSIRLLPNSDGYIHAISCEIRSETLKAANQMRFTKLF